MSRIRSQLDTILAGNGAAQTSAPRPAYEHSPAPVQPRQPIAQHSAPNKDLQSLQQSLEQLSQRINSIPKQQQRSAEASSSALHNSQAVLVNEIKSGYQQLSRDFAAHQDTSNQNLGGDLKRIADGIALLQSSQSVHPDYVEQMQAELGNLNSGLSQLINTPTSQVDLSGVSRSIETGYSDIVNKLDHVLSERGAEMPSVSVPDYSDQFVSLRESMEEITRAVVSMTVSPNNNQDNHSFERIEARLASLSKAVDDIAATPQSASLATPQSFESEIGETIAAQISQLSEKLDNVGIMGDVGTNIFADVQGIASRLDNLQNEFGVLATNLDRTLGEQTPVADGNFGEIETRLAELANNMDAMMAQPNENPNTSSQEILHVLRELVGRVEGIEQVAHAQTHATSDDAQFANLEQQLSSIAGQLGNLGPADQSHSMDLSPITERLDHIEGQIAASRDIVLDIATEAAQKAVTAGGDTHQDGAAYASILEELRHLREGQGDVGHSGQDSQQLADISTSINSIAARLADFEIPVAETAYEQPVDSTQYEPAPAQVYETSYEPPVVASSFNRPEPQPAHQTADTISHKLDTPAYEEPVQQIEETPSLDLANSEIAMEADTSRIHPVDPVNDVAEGEDVPLAPGSAMPDLEALVRNATQRKKGNASAQSETSEEDSGSTSDLLSAARRAARMASQEANNISEKPAKKSLKKPSLPSFKTPAFVNKKMLMMSAAVIAIAIGGFTLAPMILGSKTPVNVSTAPAVKSEMMAENAAIDLDVGENVNEETVRNIEGSNSALLSSEPVAQNAPKAFDQSDEAAVTASLASVESETQEMVNSGSTLDVTEIPKGIGNTALISAMVAGDGDALFEAARRYTDGDGVDRSLEDAVIWYRKAAELGHAPAQYRIGNSYEKGHGVTADQVEAAKWYSKAAAKGNVLAIHNLAVLNALGVITGEPDMTTAVGWFEKAADMGFKDSQVNLGILYTKGMGVEEDLERAYKWFAVAAKGGDNDAVKKRDTVAQAMRPEQLEKARGAAELWKPATLKSGANIATVKSEWQNTATKKVKNLSKAELVKETQILLTKAGFDAGSPDGQFGNKTKNAILDFQKKMGMKTDGKITKGLIEALVKVNT